MGSAFVVRSDTGWSPIPKKGFRLVSQTTNPKKAGEVWNAPKKSTYQVFAGCMYLDENGHVQWSGLSEYSEVGKFEEFFTNFPGLQLTKEQGSLLTYAIVGKIAICRGLAAGKSVFSLNGVPQIPSATQVEQAKKDLESWEKVKIALSLVLHKF
eukprot:gnl/Spiro4/28699_TR14197_c0_g3_i2.p1 gnl/Spiro4/28699_TR14197_c0_g3~~gnl/Spiro4/28699_TR14197_c0_g3_i2.p1  ORF type:complete len:154 (+),score=3.58 gnl/Spiro4/28699_TR14197_c0_g3_i2:840-1301(+)